MNPTPTLEELARKHASNLAEIQRPRSARPYDWACYRRRVEAELLRFAAAHRALILRELKPVLGRLALDKERADKLYRDGLECVPYTELSCAVDSALRAFENLGGMKE